MSNQTNETNHLVQYTQPSTMEHRAHYSKKSKLISSLSFSRMCFHLAWVLLSFNYVNRVIGGVFLQINPLTPDWISWTISGCILWLSHGLLFSSLEANLYTFLDKDDSTKVDGVDWGLCAGLFFLLLFVGVKGAPEAIAAFSKKENKELLSFSDVEQQVAQQKADAKDVYNESIKDINRDIERETDKAAAAANSEIARLTNYKPNNYTDKLYAQNLLRKAEQQKAAILNNIEAKYNAQKKPFRAQYNATLSRIEEDAKALRSSKKQVIESNNAKLDMKDATIENLGLYMELSFGFLCLLTTFLYVRNRVLCGIIPKARYTELDASGNLTIWGYVIGDVFKRKNQYWAITWHKKQGAKYSEVIRPDGTVVATDGNYLSKSVKKTSNGGGTDSNDNGGSSPKPPTTPPTIGGMPEGGSSSIFKAAKAAQKEKAPSAMAEAATVARARMKSSFPEIEYGSNEWKKIHDGLIDALLYPEREAAKEQKAIENGTFKPLNSVVETAQKSSATVEKAVETVQNIENIDRATVPQSHGVRTAEKGSTVKGDGDNQLNYYAAQIGKYHGHWNAAGRTNETVFRNYSTHLNSVVGILESGGYAFSDDCLKKFCDKISLWDKHITDNNFAYENMDKLRWYLDNYLKK